MTPPFFSPRELAAFLRDRGIRLTKRYGQNYLVDRHKAESIVRHMEISKDQTVLEIGPGIGTMTSLFLAEAKKVVGVEIDRGVAAIAVETFQGTDVEIIHEDFLKFDLARIPADRFKVYSSLPYNAATQIILKLAGVRNRIISMTVMLPEEIVRRMLAGPDTEEYGVFSIFMDTFFSVKDPGIRVEKRLFFPVPQVDSKIVDIVPKAAGGSTPSDERGFLSFVSGVFQNRRKYFRTALEKPLGERVGDIIFKEYGLTGTERPENVPAEAYRRIFCRVTGNPAGQ